MFYLKKNNIIRPVGISKLYKCTYPDMLENLYNLSSSLSSSAMER